MKGDFTRFSFDPTKHYSGVLMQQGRVQLDADWNEQIGVQTRYSQLVTTDLVGLTGAPEFTGGFQITPSATNPALLAISAGRIYVNGLLCELSTATTYDQQVDYPGASPQPPTGIGKDTSGNFVYLAYLDAWTQHITAIEDPNIAEIALGGVDTGTRAKTLAQVKLAALSSDVTPVAPSDWNPIIAPSGALLAATAFVPDAPGSLSLTTGYVTISNGLLVPPAPGVDFSNGFSLELWVNTPATTINSPIVYLGDGTTADTISLVTGSDGVSLTFTVGVASWTATGALDASTWTHIAVIMSTAGAVSMYKNGVLLTTTPSGTLPTAPPPNANRTLCYLGHSASGPSGAFTGMLAEVRIWSTAIAAPIVASRVNANVAGLVVYYKLNETGLTNQVVADSSPAGRNGSITGSFTWSPSSPALAAAGTSTAQYQGPENQLYRVEVHDVTALGVVTIKWSRDNGSIASIATLSAPSGLPSTQTLTLATPVRDDVLGWAVGQFVEVTTNTFELQNIPGTLAQITTILGNTLTIAAISGPSNVAAPGPVKVRRWDSNPLSASNTFTVTAAPWQSPWIPLENGIAVQFSGALPFLRGDYWVMPARTATSAITWPTTANGQPEPQLPLGITHFYCQLAKVYYTPGKTWILGALPELRPVFPPMSNAIFNSGSGTLTFGTIDVMGTFNVGNNTTPESSFFWGPITVGAAGDPQSADFWGPVRAHDGITVTGAPLNVNGVAINANDGLTVTGAPLTVTGQPLFATDGLTVSGAPLTSLTAVNVNAGLTVSNGQLTVSNGLTFAGQGLTVVNAPLNANGQFINANFGLNVSGAPLTVTGQNVNVTSGGTLTVSGTVAASSTLTVAGASLPAGDVFAVNGRSQLGDISSGTIGCVGVNASGLISANDGLTVSGAVLTSNTNIVAKAGIAVTGGPLTVTGQNVSIASGGTLTVNGLITAQNGLSVTGTSNMGAINCGAIGSGAITASGLISANDGLNVSGAALNVIGQSVNITSGGALTVNGLITAQNGLSVTGTSNMGAINCGAIGATAITASGAVTLNDGLTVNGGELFATAGMLVSGAALQVSSQTLAKGGLTVSGGLANCQAGLTVSGTLTANNDLTVSGNINQTGTNGITAVFLGLTGTMVVDGIANFKSNINCSGSINKAALSFKIDHPLDPENRYLLHSAVEAAERKNIYDGIATCDAQGVAVVALPHWFDALNEELRYQLTSIGKPAPDLHVAAEVANGRFTIGGGAPGLKVSWQITGARRDAWAKANPFVIEEDKPAEARGKYLHPEAYDQPAERGEWESVRLAAQQATRPAGKA